MASEAAPQGASWATSSPQPGRRSRFQMNEPCGTEAQGSRRPPAASSAGLCSPRGTPGPHTAGVGVARSSAGAELCFLSHVGLYTCRCERGCASRVCSGHNTKPLLLVLKGRRVKTRETRLSASVPTAHTRARAHAAHACAGARTHRDARTSCMLTHASTQKHAHTDAHTMHTYTCEHTP